MRDVTALVLGAGILCIIFAEMWYLLYKRVTEISEHLVKIIELLETPPSDRAALGSAFRDKRH